MQPHLFVVEIVTKHDGMTERSVALEALGNVYALTVFHDTAVNGRNVSGGGFDIKNQIDFFDVGG